MTKGKRFPAANKGEFDSHYASRIAKPTRKSRRNFLRVTRRHVSSPCARITRFVNASPLPSPPPALGNLPYPSRATTALSRRSRVDFWINVDFVSAISIVGYSPERFELMGRIFLEEEEEEESHSGDSIFPPRDSRLNSTRMVYLIRLSRSCSNCLCN